VSQLSMKHQINLRIKDLLSVYLNNLVPNK
jgi:hypothetical protein